MSLPLPSVTLTPSCSDTNWLYSVSTSVSTVIIGDFVTINPTTKFITIRAQNIYGVNLAVGTYPVTVKYSLISGFSTKFTFNLIIFNLRTPDAPLNLVDNTAITSSS